MEVGDMRDEFGRVLRIDIRQQFIAIHKRIEDMMLT
jgi:hypothetical protein